MQHTHLPTLSRKKKKGNLYQAGSVSLERLQLCVCVCMAASMMCVDSNSIRCEKLTRYCILTHWSRETVSLHFFKNRSWSFLLFPWPLNSPWGFSIPHNVSQMDVKPASLMTRHQFYSLHLSTLSPSASSAAQICHWCLTTTVHSQMSRVWKFLKECKLSGTCNINSLLNDFK